MNLLNGKRTYIVGACMIIYAVTGVIIGKVDYTQAIQTALLGLGMFGLRFAVKNNE